MGQSAAADASAGRAVASPNREGTVVIRRRLLDAIRLGLGSGLVVLDAPAGWGKTNVLRQLARELGDDAFWVSPNGDGQPAAEALGPAQFCATAEARHRAGTAEARAADHGVVIVDDAHLLQETAAGTAFLAELVNSVAAARTLVLAGRGMSHLVVTQQLAAGRGLLVTRGDLGFDEAEARQLVLAAGSPIDPVALLEETEGWPVGVAAALRTEGQGSEGQQREWASYLDSEVMGGLSEDAWRSLAVLSLLPVVVGAVGEAALGRDSYTALREELEHGQLPLAVTGSGSWRLHRQLRAHLLARSRAAGLLAHIRTAKRMIKLLRARDLHIHALEVAVQEGLAGAASAILRSHAEDPLWVGPHRAVADAVDMLKARRGHVPLVFEALWAESATVSAPAKALECALRVVETHSPQPIVEYLGCKAALMACRLSGNANLAARLCQRIQAVIHELPVGHARDAELEIARHLVFDIGNPRASIGLLQDWSSNVESSGDGASAQLACHSRFQVVARVAAGDLTAALNYGREALNRDETSLLAIESVSNNLALAYAALGDRYRSVQMAARVAMTRAPHTEVGIATARATLAEIMLMHGRPAVALKLIDQWFGGDLISNRDASVAPRLVPLVLSLNAAGNRDMGDARIAAGAAQTALRMAVRRNAARDIASCSIEYGRCLLVLQRHRDVVELLTPVVERLERTGEEFSLRPARIVAGLAAARLGDEESSRIMRAKAVQLLRDSSTWPALLSILMQHPAERESLLEDDLSLLDRVNQWISSQSRINQSMGMAVEPCLDIYAAVTRNPELILGTVAVPSDSVASTRMLDLLIWFALRDGARNREFLIEDLRWAVYRDLQVNKAARVMMGDLRALQQLVPRHVVTISRDTVRIEAVVDVTSTALSHHRQSTAAAAAKPGGQSIVLRSPFAQELQIRNGMALPGTASSEYEDWQSVPPRLRRILPPLAGGLSNKMIGRMMGLSEHTVENYVSHLLRLTGCHSRTALAIAAIDLGIEPIGASSEAIEPSTAPSLSGSGYRIRRKSTRRPLD